MGYHRPRAVHQKTAKCFVSVLGDAQQQGVVTGAVLAGMVWIVELVARGWFARQYIGQYFLVFMSSLMLDHPALRANQVTLFVSSLILLLVSWALLQRQERYI